MMESGTSLADLAAVSNMNNDGFGGSGGWLWFLIVMFALFNGNGFGNNQQYATAADVQRSTDNVETNARFNSLFDNQANNAMSNMSLIDRNAMDNQALIAANKYDNAVLIKDAQYTNLQNTNALASSLNQNADSIVLGMTNGFNSLNSNINDIGYQIQANSCAINRNIDSVKFENAQNTCAITNAIHQESELTRAMIQQNVIQDLRDKLEDKDRLYQAANFQISQNAQTSNILDSLGRWVSNPPIPVYTTPYYGTTYTGTAY